MHNKSISSFNMIFLTFLLFNFSSRHYPYVVWKDLYRITFSTPPSWLCLLFVVSLYLFFPYLLIPPELVFHLFSPQHLDFLHSPKVLLLLNFHHWHIQNHCNCGWTFPFLLPPPLACISVCWLLLIPSVAPSLLFCPFCTALILQTPLLHEWPSIAFFSFCLFLCVSQFLESPFCWLNFENRDNPG